ncbi:MAG: SsrA-binding protein SmpB [Armatimonadetes bacterium]|nr:SsrA-binding protein SmpB [Armatimonadota bacterium]
MAETPERPSKLITKNRKAWHEYHILETMEAGIMLVGTEVKSLRQGNVNMVDSYAAVKDGEVWLFNLHISPFEKGTHFNHEPLRPRKVLLHKREISRLIGKTQEKGLTLIPLRLFFNPRGKVKLELGLCKGKKLYDKRAAKAEQDARREMERAVKVGTR